MTVNPMTVGSTTNFGFVAPCQGKASVSALDRCTQALNPDEVQRYKKEEWKLLALVIIQSVAFAAIAITAFALACVFCSGLLIPGLVMVSALAGAGLMYTQLISPNNEKRREAEATAKKLAEFQRFYEHGTLSIPTHVNVTCKVDSDEALEGLNKFIDKETMDNLSSFNTSKIITRKLEESSKEPIFECPITALKALLETLQQLSVKYTIAGKGLKNLTKDEYSSYCRELGLIPDASTNDKAADPSEGEVIIEEKEGKQDPVVISDPLLPLPLVAQYAYFTERQTLEQQKYIVLSNSREKADAREHFLQFKVQAAFNLALIQRSDFTGSFESIASLQYCDIIILTLPDARNYEVVTFTENEKLKITRQELIGTNDSALVDENDDSLSTQELATRFVQAIDQSRIQASKQSESGDDA